MDLSDLVQILFPFLKILGREKTMAKLGMRWYDPVLPNWYDKMRKEKDCKSLTSKSKKST